LAVVLGSWALSTGAAAIMLAFLAGVVFLPTLCDAITGWLRKPVDLPWSMHCRATLGAVCQPLARG
ncbi:MAG: hypothetical protein WCJ18_11015, partial [Planctomycetota bacterium]